MPFEADVPPGLEAFALSQCRGAQRLGPGRIGLESAPSAPPGWALRLYDVLHFAVPRPKALLGHAHFTRLTQAARAIVSAHPKGTFRTLRLAAAGADSAVLTRLACELAAALGLERDATRTDDANLLLRLRRAGEGWDALLSRSPRPLSTRPWRVCDMPGALNAAVACAMATLSEPSESDDVLNLCCGSGTILIERARLGPAKSLLGCDNDPKALACAAKNVAAATLGERIALHPWDGANVPLDDGSISTLFADLPFGQRIGSHDENVRLYPALLREATRLARPGARLLLLTHDFSLLRRTLEGGPWQVQSETKISAGGMHPRLFLCRMGPC